MAAPLLMLLATPFFVARLGLERYGLWMLAAAIAGTVGVFSVGFGNTTIKYVSGYRASGDTDGVIHTVRGTLMLHVAFGTLLAAGVLLAAPALARSVFAIGAAYEPEAVAAIRVAALGVVARAVDSVTGATLRGLERYDLAARVSIAVRIGGVAAAVGLIAAGHGVPAALGATIAAMAVGAVAGAVLCRRLVPGLTFVPRLDRRTAADIVDFGIYSWLQGVAAMLFSQADRLVIGVMLGPAALGVYSVCLQLAQQVHTLAAAGFHFLFPMVSARAAQGGTPAIRTVYRSSVWLGIVAAAVLALPLVAFAEPILRIWMGSAFAAEAHGLLTWLALAFFLLAANTVPHNTLLGLGDIRFVTGTNVLGGILSLAAAIVLIPVLGLLGAAIGRLAYGPVVSINYLQVARRL